MARKSKTTFKAPDTPFPADYRLAVDNGMDGGVVLLDKHNNIVAQTRTFSETAAFGAMKTASQLDVTACYRWVHQTITSLPAGSRVRAFVERPNNAHTMWTLASMRECYGSWRTMLVLSKLVEDVLPITPQWWQMGDHSVLHLKRGQDTKKAALAKARELWKDHDWRASPRCSTPHDGIVDAALIAYFANKHGL